MIGTWHNLCMRRRAVLVCLTSCGHGRGNRARLSGRAASPSMRPLGVYIYAVGPQSCRIHRAQKGSARLGPTKLRFCAKTLFLGAFRSAFGFAPQNATRFSAVTRPRPWPRMAPVVEFGAVLGISASLPLPAPPLPSSSRRYAPQCFVAGIPAPCLATCLIAHPTNRVVACRSVRRSPPRPLPHLP